MQKCTIWLTLLHSAVLVASVSSLNTYALPTFCKNDDKIVNVLSPESGTGSSGILKTSQISNYYSNTNCSFVLKPQRGVSLLLAVRRIDIRSGCKDNVTIYTKPFEKTALCGSKKSDSETQTFVANGDMRIQFQSGSGFTLGYKGFELVFTAFNASSNWCWESKSLFQCANRRCIASRLRCDGHNHCGDRSDQEKCGPSAGAIAGYVIGTIFLVIAAVAGIVYFTKRRRVVTTTTTYPNTGVMYPPPYNQPQYQQTQQPYNPNYR